MNITLTLRGSSSINNPDVSMSQVKAVIIAGRAERGPAHDQANIAVKYEDLKHTQPFPNDLQK